MDPSTTRTNGSSSPRSALCHHSMKLSAPCSGPHSKSISGQCTATFGRPGSAPTTISSMDGCVAAVSATESPSQPRPPFIHKIWITGSVSAVVIVDLLAANELGEPWWPENDGSPARPGSQDVIVRWAGHKCPALFGDRSGARCRSLLLGHRVEGLMQVSEPRQPPQPSRSPVEVLPIVV